MTVGATRRPRAAHDAVAALFEPGLAGTLNELCNQMLYMSGVLARIRRSGVEDARVTTELSALDAAFDRSITLARLMSERLSVKASAGAFVSMSRVVREVVGLLQPSLPDDVSLRVVCPERAVLAAGEHVEVRWILAMLLGCAIDLLPTPGEFVVEVTEPPKVVPFGDLPSVGLAVRCPAFIDPRESELDAVVRPAVNAMGGVFEVSCAAEAGATTLTVHLPSVC